MVSGTRPAVPASPRFPPGEGEGVYPMLADGPPMQPDGMDEAPAAPRFPGPSLVACDDCGDVFIQWSRGSASCRHCRGVHVHEVRWPGDARATR